MNEIKSPWKYYQVSSIEQQQKNWAESIKQIAVVKNIAELLYTVDQTKAAGLDNMLDLNIFKQNIQPMWEDPNNVCGGRIIMELPVELKDILHDLWAKTVVFAALEPFDTINGCVYAKKTNYRICLWIGDASLADDILAAWKSVLDCKEATFVFSVHNKGGDSYKSKKKTHGKNKERS